MKILITGGAGFIGSHLAAKLLERGDEVVIIDNFCDFYDPKIKERNVLELSQSNNCRIYREDILNWEKLKKIFEKEKPRKVVHLAARAGVRPSLKEPRLYSEVNVTGTTNLLELAKDYQVENFVFASSSSVYGNCRDLPFREDSCIDFPISTYAATKKAGELLCAVYSNIYKLPCACLRFFTVYGPNGRPDMAPYKFVRAVLRGEKINKYGTGRTERDYTYIDDIIAGVIAAVDSKFQYEVFNLGDSRTVRLDYFINLVEKLVQKKALVNHLPMQPGDVEITFADISKARSLLSYQPKVSFEEGMAKFVNWFKKYGV